MDYEAQERDFVANVVAQEFLGINKATNRKMSDKEQELKADPDDTEAVSPQTKRILRKFGPGAVSSGSEVEIVQRSALKIRLESFED